MLRVRSFRRLGGIATAVLVPLALAFTASCATGGDGGGSLEGGGPFDGNGFMPDTGPQGDVVQPGFDSGKTDSGGADTGKSDTGAMDAGVDTTTAPDTSVMDVATLPDTSACVTVTVTAGSPSMSCPGPVYPPTCGMGDVSAFAPSWVPPSGYHLGACTATEITNIYAACFGKAATPTKCAKVDTTPCYACVVTAEGSGTYGPLISAGGIVSINQGGCIDLLEPCNSACAQAQLGAFQCENAACETNCPVVDTPSFTAYEGCVTNAINCDPDGCNSYYTEATNCGALLTGPSHPASICIASSLSTFKSLYDAVAPLFCGP